VPVFALRFVLSSVKVLNYACVGSEFCVAKPKIDYVLVSQCFCEVAVSLRLCKVSESCQTCDAEIDIIACGCDFMWLEGLIDLYPSFLKSWLILWVALYYEWWFFRILLLFLWSFLATFLMFVDLGFQGLRYFGLALRLLLHFAIWLSEDSSLQSRALYFFSFLVPMISLKRVQRLTCWLYGLLLNNSIKILIMG
jgi:hypothetical protein